MPDLDAMTWNIYGGSTANAAAAITALNIDITVLQETRNNGGHAFYAPLNGLAGYTVSGPYLENVPRFTPNGNLLAPDPNQRRSYAVVSRNATIAIVAVALVDYTVEYAPIPGAAHAAAARGYNQRPPLRIEFRHLVAGGTRDCVMYSWHAPVKLWNVAGLTKFDRCPTLAADVATGNLVIIGADMNTVGVGHVFGAFDGLADGFDHLLAANAAGGVTDLRTTPGITVPQIAALNALYSPSHGRVSHWAVPGRVNY